MSVLTKRETETAVRPALPRVNLLPPEIGERAHFRRLQWAAGGVALVTVGAVAATYIGVLGQVGDAQSELDAAQSSRAALQHQVHTYDHVVAVRSQVDARKQMLQQALTGEIHWSNYLTGLSLTTPSNVWLTQMSVTPIAPAANTATGASGKAAAPATTPANAPTAAGVATITFEGYALDYNDVATWLESLTKVKAFSDPYLTEGTEKKIGAKTAVNFTGTITVTQDALVPNPAGN